MINTPTNKVLVPVYSLVHPLLPSCTWSTGWRWIWNPLEIGTRSPHSRLSTETCPSWEMSRPGERCIPITDGFCGGRDETKITKGANIIEQ